MGWNRGGGCGTLSKEGAFYLDICAGDTEFLVMPLMGGASGVAGGAAPCALFPAPRLPLSRRDEKLHVPSRPFPSIVAA